MLLPAVFGVSLFDDLFDSAWPEWDDGFDRGAGRALATRSPFGKRAQNLMKTDVKENGANYEMAIDLPGFKKEDVHLSLKDGYLTIQAARTHTNEEKNEEGRFIRQERYSGSCARSFYVGESVKPEDIGAKFEDGILRVTLPRTEARQLPANNVQRIEIE